MTDDASTDRPVPGNGTDGSEPPPTGLYDAQTPVDAKPDLQVDAPTDPPSSAEEDREYLATGTAGGSPPTVPTAPGESTPVDTAAIEVPDPGTDPDRENPAGEPVEPAGTRTGAETFRDYLRAVNGLPPSGSPAAGPEDGPPDNRTEAERLAAYWVGINSFDPPGGWGAPQNAPADRGPVRFQWQVGRGGVGDFVRVPNFDNSSGQPGVVIEPSREGATFAAVARPGDGDTSRIDVNTGQIQPGGSQRRTIRRSKGDQAPIPPTRRPLTAAEGRRFLGSRSCRGRGPPSPALVPSRRAPVERPAQPAPAQPQEPTWQQRAGQVGGVLLDVMTYPHPLGPRGALGPLI